jgi:HD-GYP domain-containing protein (c-di-GMP phosphodiesterase class II)
MSKSNPVYEVDTLSIDRLSSFFETFSEANLEIEQSLLMLELDSNDVNCIAELANAINAVHAAIHEIGLHELCDLTQSLIDMLWSVRTKELRFETVLSDVILLAINDVKIIVEAMLESKERCVLLDRLPRVCNAINQIAKVDDMYLNSATKDALLLLDPTMEIIEPNITTSDSLINLFQNNEPDEEELAAYGVEENQDFIFFRGLSEPLETRANYWQGRGQRMLRLALKMNDEAGRPVDPTQLAAAVYMHDVGMALLPLEVINSSSALSEEELALVKKHPIISFELLRYMKQWAEAAGIVLQHHEKMDGSGYPYGLKEVEICEGAKILAIVDAIDARTHERVHTTLLKRPLLRAAMEIGKNSDNQFSAYWSGIFKKVFQQMRKHVTELEIS